MRLLVAWRTYVAKWRRGQWDAFPNVPEWLTTRVREIANTIDLSDRNSVYFNAAGWVIAQYLDKDASSPEDDELFDHSTVEGPDSRWHGHVNHVIVIGETLFLLRSTPGFPEFCRRLKQRTFRSAFFEMLAAKQFFKVGFNLHARPEVNILGEDFDFNATRDSERVNVEVTALEADSFSEKTILNALEQKRKQLPDTSPAVIYCVLPERWFPDPTLWNNELPKIATRFFRQVRRINVIVFLVEKHIDVDLSSMPSGAAFILMRQAFANPNARMPVQGMAFLLGGKPAAGAVQATQTGVGLNELVDESNSSEFFRWVDHLVPAAKG